MKGQYRRGDLLVCAVVRIPDIVPPGAERRRSHHRGAGFSRAAPDRASGHHTMGGNSVSTGPVKREPGATLELLFQREPDLKPGPFLAYLVHRL
jgi:hypothetical protein